MDFITGPWLRYLFLKSNILLSLPCRGFPYLFPKKFAFSFFCRLLEWKLILFLFIMISLKICVQFCAIKRKFALICSDLLPKKHGFVYLHTDRSYSQPLIIADMLHKSLKTMKIDDDEEPLTLPDSPRFRVFDGNSISLLGRLLNPDCQSMERMIDYMPTAWRLHGRVRGIALSRDRFQFIFQREEDLQTVLNDRPWSYNHWLWPLRDGLKILPQTSYGTCYCGFV